MKKNNQNVKTFTEIILVLLGILSATIGLKGFLLPNGFYDGGAMGIALLLDYFVQGDLALYIILINIPFVLIGIKQISWAFAIRSAAAIFMLAMSVHFLEIPTFTHDKILISIFGGVFLGMGIGLSMRGGSVIDGTEVLAVSVSRRSSLSVGDFIALFNLGLFLIVAFWVNLETAMYSMLTYFAASKSVDFLISGIEEYIGVTVISADHEKIRQLFVNDLLRGVTVYKIEGGFNKAEGDERKALFCAVTRLEVSTLINEVEKIDPDAFIIQYALKDTRGGMIKKRPLH
jgi:uncharacterized membrane-anchored protein YitT (DUF2179 family)